jgi:hypothetical protein
MDATGVGAVMPKFNSRLSGPAAMENPPAGSNSVNSGMDLDIGKLKLEKVFEDDLERSVRCNCRTYEQKKKRS